LILSAGQRVLGIDPPRTSEEGSLKPNLNPAAGFGPWPQAEQFVEALDQQQGSCPVSRTAVASH
jgi:hypothetical protein